MKSNTTDSRRLATIAIFVGLQALAGTAGADGLSGLRSQMGSLGGGLSGGGMGTGLNGSGALSPVAAGNSGNVAGVLQYCIKNNYLSGSSATSLKERLTSNLPGGQPSADSGYRDGAQGLLDSGNGKRMNLGGGGIKAQATKQVCAKVLDQAKSML
jgi:hypothetical protein